MDLRQYEQNKFAIAEILRAGSADVRERVPALRERVETLFARLAEDRFNLVVIGRFNRGKTSLMNAMLATNRLPTGLLPLTSVVTTVAYGSKERVILKFSNRILDKEIPIEALPQHITQEGNPGNVRRIVTAEIQLPAEILRRGFRFVDTPGLGSAIVENTLTTEAFLPEADALILVTSYESPLAEDELRHITTALSSRKRVFVVLNKHDIVSAEQRASIWRFVRARLNGLFGACPVPLFSISSTEGIAARLSGDAARLQASGIREFETQLTDFMLREKSREFLAQMCERVKEFLREMPRSEENAARLLEIAALVDQFNTVGQHEPREPAVPSGVDSDMHNLAACEICAAVASEQWDFLCAYQYEIIINRAEQQRLADDGGLCPFHAWQLQSVASRYGLCAAYPPLLDRLAAELRKLASRADDADVSAHIRALLPSHADCALCNARDTAERRAVEATAKRLQERRADALKGLSAVCLPHFALLLSTTQTGDLVRTLLERHAAVLQRFAEDMKRYAIKRDGIRRHLASDEELAAAERGLLLLAGHRLVNFSPRSTRPLLGGDTCRHDGQDG